MLWLVFNIEPPTPLAKQGVLDLRGLSFDDKRIVTLDGEWEFYPGEFLQAQSMERGAERESKQSIQVPGAWKQRAGTGTNLGIGTYRLRVLIDHSAAVYGLRIPGIQTASRLYINKVLIRENGRPAEDAGKNEANNNPYSVYFEPDSGEIDLLIHVSNFDYPYAGGITQSIKLGTATAISHDTLVRQSLQLMVAVVILMHALYGVILFLLGYRKRTVLFFAAMLVSTFIAMLSDDDRLLMEWLPFNFVWTIKIRLISYMAIGLLLIWFAREMFAPELFRRFMRWFNVFAVACLLAAITLPLDFIVYQRKLLLIICLLNIVLVPWFVLGAIRRGEKDVFVLLLSAAAVSVNQLVGGIIKTYFWKDMPYYPFDLIITFLGFAAFWFNRFYQNTLRVQKLADDLQKADKLKDDFLANTSHELRNPLHGIINMAQSMLDQAGRKLELQSKGQLELIINVGRRMALLLNDLLDVTLLKEQNFRLDKGWVNLHGLASGVADMLRYLSEGKRLKVVIDIPMNFPRVVADENRLVQILFNLVHNAIKYTEEGTITISAGLKNGKAMICIKDTGIGMEKETQQRILKPYERGDTGITAIGGGIGLGLSITKQLVELHGGNLEIHSTPGRGTEFSFTLEAAPNLAEMEAASAAEFEARRETRVLREDGRDEETYTRSPLLDSSPAITAASSEKYRAKILVVDDDPVNLRILGDMLALEHYDITSVLSAKEALERLHQGEWDLVISDVMMPHMSGYELTGKIRRQFSISELPIILLTARNRPEDVQAAFVSGANDYVTKPVGAMELRLRIRAWMDLKQSVGERLRMEAAWLQAQIQPHFLHNALNTIASLSEVDTERMVALLNEFGNYLRRSFDPINMNQLLPLDDELELLHSYLYIEKERFGSRIHIQWDITEEARGTVRIPPLSVQTLVENALKHGILPKNSGGTVTIAVADFPDRTEVTVKDDGLGMDEEQWHGALQASSEASEGVGLKNTDKRLRQLYGKGLQISSAPGKGTVVSFSVPKTAE
ncbi:ATP-binding protein [Paenibacillus sp. P96]|uniref:histidine kinase n=1 Tax=Paenibacillus zeirhizosphaerae TaxID=2987519 RepID=A0ABT9FSE5_9BACL|nr:ATP-binding protein [Paenibacillus sp. P96]MDP4097636.1 ATP-binding protein [Paenibacillus sp. P96]